MDFTARRIVGRRDSADRTTGAAPAAAGVPPGSSAALPARCRSRSRHPARMITRYSELNTLDMPTQTRFPERSRPSAARCRSAVPGWPLCFERENLNVGMHTPRCPSARIAFATRGDPEWMHHRQVPGERSCDREFPSTCGPAIRYACRTDRPYVARQHRDHAVARKSATRRSPSCRPLLDLDGTASAGLDGCLDDACLAEERTSASRSAVVKAGSGSISRTKCASSSTGITGWLEPLISRSAVLAVKTIAV